ncbi:sensor histidine kinase [Peptostreptococcaceae bacterium AGR-M142]
MSILKFLNIRKSFIIFFIILMLFISLIIRFDPNFMIGKSNIIYINMISLFLFFIYLIYDYYRLNIFFSNLDSIYKKAKEDRYLDIKKGQNEFENKIYNLFSEIYNFERNRFNILYDEKKENKDYIMSFVHEIKLPIAAMKLELENNEDIVMLKDSLEDEIKRIEDEVEKILYSFRLDSFSNDYIIDEVNLNKLINKSIKSNAKNFINKAIKIDLDDLNKNVLSDYRWLYFIINQIISNALKYTDKKGQIKIYLKEDDKFINLIIKDNGIGIKQIDKKRVFDKGFSGSSNRTNKNATGMGLYLSKKLCDKLNHLIEIDSKEDEYTKFIISFYKDYSYLNILN